MPLKGVPLNSKFKRNCRVCMDSRGNIPLQRRINKAKFDRQTGDESLGDIAKQFGWSGVNIYNHAKKHLVEPRHQSTEHYAHRVEAKAEGIRQAVIARELGITDPKQAEIINQTMIKSSSEDVWDTIIDLGADAIRTGKLRITLPMLLKAAKDKADYDSHKKDRELEVIKMVTSFASGEVTELITETTQIEGKENVTANDATTAEEHDNSGQDGPDTLYREVTRDAVAQWAATVPEGYTGEET